MQLAEKRHLLNAGVLKIKINQGVYRVCSAALGGLGGTADSA